MNVERSLTRYFSPLPLLAALTLYGCGATHVRTHHVGTEMASAEIHQYEKVFISEVDVDSQEETARDNVVLQAKMDEWEKFARGELEGYVNDSHYQLLTEPPGAAEKALIMNLDIDMVYGSRAKRYWIGSGAGRGSVDSVLTASDNQTGEQKFRAVAESSLSVGGFGGDMEKVLIKNVRDLVDQYPRVPDEVR